MTILERRSYSRTHHGKVFRIKFIALDWKFIGDIVIIRYLNTLNVGHLNAPKTHKNLGSASLLFWLASKHAGLEKLSIPSLPNDTFHCDQLDSNRSPPGRQSVSLTTAPFGSPINREDFEIAFQGRSMEEKDDQVAERYEYKLEKENWK